MTITLPPEIEAALIRQSQQEETTPEQLALDTLRERVLGARPGTVPPEGHEAWVAQVSSLGLDCGVSPPSVAMSSDALYE